MGDNIDALMVKWDKEQNELKEASKLLGPDFVLIDENVSSMDSSAISSASSSSSNTSALASASSASTSAAGASSGSKLRVVAGTDISFVKDTNIAVACITLMKYPDMSLIHAEYLMMECDVPYVPGYLAFREVAPLFQCFNNMKKKIDELSQAHKEDFTPQVILVDGNGILHPKEFGLACHLGAVLNIPTIGVGKTFFHADGLTMTNVKPLIQQLDAQGDDAKPYIELKGDSGKVLAVAFCAKSKGYKNPVFVSVGHRISLDTAIKIIERCSIYRVPEPIRQADLLGRAWLRENVKI